MFHVEHSQSRDLIAHARTFGDGLRMEEVWKEIEGTNGKHWFSNYGRAKSIRNGRERFFDLGRSNIYQQITVHIEGKRKNLSVHRLVAEAFIPNPDNKPQVNHIDGTRWNNHYTNLEWVTIKENIQHALRTGLWDELIGSKSKLVRCVNTDEVFASTKEAAAAYKINHRNIATVCRGERPLAGGFKWEYVTQQKAREQ